MISKGLVELTKCRLREFTREPSALLFVVLMPVIWMLTIGYAFTQQKEEKFFVGLLKPSAVVSSQYKTVQKTLSDHLKIQLSEGTEEGLKQKLKTNKISLIVTVEKDSLIYSYDSDNPKAFKSRSIVDDLLQEKFGRKDVVTIKESIYIPPGSRYIDFLIPGLIALSLLTTSLFGTGMVIIVSRREKLLQRLLVTPMKKTDYFLSHILGRFFVVLLEVFVILLVGFLFFGFVVKGSFLLFLFLCFLGAACFTSLAVFCASKGKNSSAYSGLVNLLALFLMFLSGVWFSRNGFPGWLQLVGDFSPLSALVDSLRKVSLEGFGPFVLMKELALLGGYTLLFLVLSLRSFSWR